jgi:para-nitrobenzyl esterase
VESGAFALNQIPLASAEAFGESFATSVGCADQSVACLRHVPVDELVAKFPAAAIPGVVDGQVLTEPIGTSLAAGRFAHVPLINGINHVEEFLFVAGLGAAVVNGQFVRVPADVRVPQPVSEATYESAIASVLSVSNARAADIAAEYPQATYGIALVALSVLVSDANFACPALQVDRVTAAQGVPTYAYEFDDDTAPQRFGALPPIVTHSGEIQYLFGQPNTPIPATLDASQAALADTMKNAWATFAAYGNPSSTAVPWPAFNSASQVLSLASPSPQVQSTFAATHHCDFWAAG